MTMLVTDEVETWLPIPDWLGYEVSDHGRVRSFKGWGSQGIPDYTKPPKILKHEISHGYHRVMLCNPTQEKHIRVHVLVLTSFVGVRPQGMYGAHNDGDKNNNYLSNLRWATPQENTDDRLLHGTRCVGSKNPKSKLTEEDVVAMRSQYNEGATVRELSKYFGVSKTNVKWIVSRKTWRHVE